MGMHHSTCGMLARLGCFFTGNCIRKEHMATCSTLKDVCEGARSISLNLLGNPMPKVTPRREDRAWAMLQFHHPALHRGVRQTGSSSDMPSPSPARHQRGQKDVQVHRQWRRKQLWLHFPSAPWGTGRARKPGPDLALGST